MANKLWLRLSSNNSVTAPVTHNWQQTFVFKKIFEYDLNSPTISLLFMNKTKISKTHSPEMLCTWLMTCINMVCHIRVAPQEQMMKLNACFACVLYKIQYFSVRGKWNKFLMLNILKQLVQPILGCHMDKRRSWKTSSHG